MKKIKLFPNLKTLAVLVSLSFAFMANAKTTSFEAGKPEVSFSTKYDENYTSGVKPAGFDFQWLQIGAAWGTNGFSNGYCEFLWADRRIIFSAYTLYNPYTLSADMEWSTAGNPSSAGIVLRGDGGTDNWQDPSGPGDPFNRIGIAIFPNSTGTGFNVKFSGVIAEITPSTIIAVPAPSGVTNTRVRATIKVEDYGNMVFVYYNGSPYFRINLDDIMVGYNYKSGTVYGADGTTVLGSFTNMSILPYGTFAIAQRDAALRLYSAKVEKSSSTGLTWDQRPSTNYATTYTQNFNSWDATTFNAQWNTYNAVGSPDNFTAADVITTDPANGYLLFSFVPKAIIQTKTAPTVPYAFTANISNAGTLNNGGIVMRAIGEPWRVQNGASGGGFAFATTGIAIYPAHLDGYDWLDGQNTIIQFCGAFVSDATPVTRILVPTLAGVNSFARNTYRIEDYGSSVYIYCNGNPFVRIELGGLTGTTYTSGTVYTADMTVAGTFTGKEINATGLMCVARRDAALKLYSAKMEQSTLTTKLNNVTSTEINAYQDGSSVVVDLNGLSGRQTINFFTLNGKNVITKQTNGGEKVILNNVLKTGVYLVKVKGEGSSYNAKLIVK